MAIKDFDASTVAWELALAEEFGLDPATTIRGSLVRLGPDRLAYDRYDPSGPRRTRWIATRGQPAEKHESAPPAEASYNEFG